MNINWQEYFYYDEGSPTGLRHLKNRMNVKAGAVAGTLKKKYSLVRLYNATYSVHRVIWELHYGKIPLKCEIDHIDGNSRNNRIENLRCVSSIVNKRNKRLGKNNWSGYVGVTYNKTGYWVAFWNDLDGKLNSKYFSLRKYDYVTAKVLAIAWRKTKMAELNNLGAGYTERHGKG